MNDVKSALRRAMQNEQDGARLLELAREDVTLRNEMPGPWKSTYLKDIFEVTRAIYEERLEILRAEKELILNRYKDPRYGGGRQYGV